MSVIDLISQIKLKCLQNDCDIYEQLNISQAEYNFFLASLNIEELDTNNISKEMGISLSRLSRVVDMLVKHGFLSRTASKLDRRAIVLKMTKKGKDIQNKIVESRLKCEQKILSQLNTDEITEITQILNKLSLLMNKE